MKRFLTVLALALQLCAIPSPATAADRPNILFILADDQSYKTAGCYPESWPWVKTPNIDKLAATGIRFHAAYLGAWCMPSRATLLTGRHPHAVESMRMAKPYPASAYDPQQCPFWPAVFRQQGYQTAHIGKWHTGVDSGWGRDWDYQRVWNRPKHPENAGAYYEKQIVAFNGEEREVDGYPADNYTDWACDYIKGEGRSKDKPWYLWLCYGSIHGPSKPAARHKGTYADAQVPVPADIFPPRPGKPDYLNQTQAWIKGPNGEPVAGKSGESFGDESGKKVLTFDAWVKQVNECMPAVDEGVARLIATLKETGQYDNTLVAYSADQGFAMGEHGFRTKLAPYDANYRSPLIVSMPSRLPQGQFVRHPVNGADLVATFCSFAGITPSWTMQGRDLTPLLHDAKSEWSSDCYYEFTGDHYGPDVTRVVKDSPKEAVYHSVPWYSVVVDDHFKYIRYLEPGVPEELYDLDKDPEELVNLAHDASHAATLTQMRDKMQAQWKELKAPFASHVPAP